jgi:hypothetical protein
MRAYLIRRSKSATGRDSEWNDEVYDSIAWQHLGQAFQKHTVGQRIQLSKYMNDLLPTLRRLQTFDNRSDGRCFACNQLWEDTNHVLRCRTEARYTARATAFQVFRLHLQKQHTPDIMANLICGSMHSWIDRTRIIPPTCDHPEEPITTALRQAFTAQRLIGWDQFLRGRIALKWKDVITAYYHERRPGPAFTPDQWMRTTINAIWTFALTLWRHRNAEYHGDQGNLTHERHRKLTALRATEVYRDTLGSVSPSDSFILHRTQIAEILNWTKQHLDAYLATAEVICEWNIEPG